MRRYRQRKRNKQNNKQQQDLIVAMKNFVLHNVLVRQLPRKSYNLFFICKTSNLSSVDGTVLETLTRSDRFKIASLHNWRYQGQHSLEFEDVTNETRYNSSCIPLP